ncbi:sensor domain-containing diguanylate cyclase [Uliginosibacterium aquaticum]|uniref:Diguanylate cyclase n=1 Tax=Uliginosibacterium aquaticum TaxID=2731212 RepID=A0ABX2IN32_9RHOO|nr:diguanylate cyclase [Uliginosibacterium aquaticum]NSL55530.1 diguanylate cyclase [Uliginosibacterium aquaticum]
MNLLSSIREIAVLAALPALLVALALFFAWPPTLALPLLLLTAVLSALLRLTQLRRQHAVQSERQQAFMQRLIDVIPQPVYVKDSAARYLMVNQSLANRLGREPAELIGCDSCSFLSDTELIAHTRQEDAAALSGARITAELHDTDPLSGKPRDRLIMKGTCLNAEGKPVIVGANFDITHWREAEQALQAVLQREQAQQLETRAWLQRLIDVIPYPIYVKDADSHYQLVNQAFEKDKGLPGAELIGRTGVGPVHPDRLAQVLTEDAKVLRGEPLRKEEHRAHARTGAEVFRIITKGVCTDERGNTVIVGAHVDITELRQAQRHLQEALERETGLRQRTEAFLQRLVDVIPDPVYIKDSNSRYLLVNEAFAEYRQLDRDFILGPNFPFHGPTTPARAQSEREDQAVLGGQEVVKEEHTIRKGTGEEVFRIVRKRRSVFFDGRPVVIGIDHNITRWRVAERELQQLAQEDGLTGLANRRHFHHEAERAIDLAQRYQQALSLILIDLDHFKQINDLYGHHAGDLVLVETVRRLREGLRRADFPGRWGGEEFIILLPHTELAEAVQVAERLRAAVGDSLLQIEGRQLAITLSAGVAQRRIGEGLESFIARADSALYVAKNEGRNRVLAEARPADMDSRATVY